MTTGFESCPECGASVPKDGSCLGLFHELLLLEWRIPGGPGAFPHFYAVATYGLQHPRAMNYTAGALFGLRDAVRDALEGRATIERLRDRARDGARIEGRVSRKEGDPEVRWGVDRWAMTISDVIAVQPEAHAYADRVSRWARSVIGDLDAATIGRTPAR